MQIDAEVWEFFQQRKPLDKNVSVAPLTVAQWLFRSEWQPWIFEQLLTHPEWACSLFAWLEKARAFVVAAVCHHAVRHEGTHPSVLMWALRVAPADSPLVTFCLARAAEARFHPHSWNIVLHSLCEQIRSVIACADTVRRVIDAGRITRIQSCHVVTGQCRESWFKYVIEQRNLCAASVLAVVCLRRRVPVVRCCVPRDVMAVIGRMVWETRWCSAWNKHFFMMN